MHLTSEITSSEESFILSLFDNIFDPEIPVLSINDLGIVRKIIIHEPKKGIEIAITSTYSGCPAMDVIRSRIRFMLLENGYSTVNIISELSPAWTSDWISDEGKQKLKAYGIAPPGKTNNDELALFASPPTIQCPQCNSTNTSMLSEFGSTSCKSLYRCNDCHEPFDVFKCH